MMSNSYIFLRRFMLGSVSVVLLSMPVGAFAYCNNWIPQWRLELVSVEATGESVSADDLAEEEVRWDESGLFLQQPYEEFGWLSGIFEDQLFINRVAR